MWMSCLLVSEGEDSDDMLFDVQTQAVPECSGKSAEVSVKPSTAGNSYTCGTEYDAITPDYVLADRL